MYLFPDPKIKVKNRRERENSKALIKLQEIQNTQNDHRLYSFPNCDLNISNILNNFIYHTFIFIYINHFTYNKKFPDNQWALSSKSVQKQFKTVKTVKTVQKQFNICPDAQLNMSISILSYVQGVYCMTLVKAYVSMPT